MEKNKLLWIVPMLFAVLFACDDAPWESDKKSKSGQLEKDSLQVLVVLQKTPAATGTLTLQIVNAQDVVQVEETIDVDAIASTETVVYNPVLKYNETTYSSYTFFGFMGFYDVLDAKCKIKIKRSVPDSPGNSVYWYASLPHKGIYKNVASSLAEDTNLNVIIHYMEYPGRSENEEFQAFDYKCPLTQDWTWQEFLLD
jgi:hypothetical protein